MHLHQTGPNSLAYYVTNYHTVDDAVVGHDPLPTVAMEWSNPNGAPAPFTQFYAFEQNGQRITAVDLDGNGSKFLPGMCAVCHGGTPASFDPQTTPYPNQGNIGAAFVPFDLNSFHYSAQLPRSAQEGAFKILNETILNTNASDAVELIRGWYATSGLPPGQLFDGSFRPVAWTPQPPELAPNAATLAVPASAGAVYDNVVKWSCRSCHLQIGLSKPGLGFGAFAEFAAVRDTIHSMVCQIGDMPRAQRTYKNFWLSFPGQAQALGDFVRGLPVTLVAPVPPGETDLAMSADGRFVAFASNAGNIVGSDTNGQSDVFVYDGIERMLTRESLTSNGMESAGSSGSPVGISADGTKLVFQSNGDLTSSGNTTDDVYLRDRGADTVQDLTSTGNVLFDPAISGDGNYVAIGENDFKTQFDCSDPVTGEPNLNTQIRRLPDGKWFTLKADSTCANGDSETPVVLSADGSLAAFATSATNLTAVVDGNNTTDIVVANVSRLPADLVSLSTAGVQADGGSYHPAMSDDGRFVAFASDATNLAPEVDTNGKTDVFVRDRIAGTTERVSVSSGGGEANGGSDFPAISADGHFVAFVSRATNLVTGISTGGTQNVYVRDRWSGQTSLVTIGFDGSPANGDSFGPVISDDGTMVAFVSRAFNLVANDGDGSADVFVADLGVAGNVTCGSVWPGAKPVARIVTTSSGQVGVPVVMDATSSLYAAGFQWNLVSLPVKSHVTLGGGSTSIATLTPDQVGEYIVELEVTDAHGRTDTTWASVTTGQQVSFGSNIQPIFTTSCALAGCHVAGAQEPDLSVGHAWSALQGHSTSCTSEAFVVPGDPSPTQSYLMATVLGVGTLSACGTVPVMPPAGTLPSSSISLLSEWITQGAKDN
jgi:Tol biopolymer transport system component